jgi:hypothetical protein
MAAGQTAQGDTSIASGGRPRTAVAWFVREDWDEIKRLCIGVPNSYDEWLTRAEAAVLAMLSHGLSVEKVVLRPSLLRRRQRVTGRKVDGRGRAALAAKVLSDEDKSVDLERVASATSAHGVGAQAERLFPSLEVRRLRSPD